MVDKLLCGDKMSQKFNKLPEYPCKRDMWDALAEEKRPIVVYGMGNGADKLIERFDKYGIKISDFFASDGFVRGHLFHGMRVKSFSEIREQYDDFVIVLSFASNRREVIDMLYDVSDRYDMYVPDMPVAGTEEYFDRDFYNSNYNDICAAYRMLADDFSKHIFASVVSYKLSGKMEYLRAAFTSRDDQYAYLPCQKIENIIDAGAYNGDTLKEAKTYFSNLKNAVAIEPDNRNFKKLTKYCEAETDISVTTVNAAAWCDNCDGTFNNSGNRNSSVSSTASYEHRSDSINLITVDSVCGGKVDYIKYDVEGAEHEALIGSHNTILQNKPALLVSAYHRSKDIFSIPIYLKDNYPFYAIYLSRLECIPAWELNVIAIPKE